jgi:hypothetical protein
MTKRLYLKSFCLQSHINNVYEYLVFSTHWNVLMFLFFLSLLYILLLSLYVPLYLFPLTHSLPNSHTPTHYSYTISFLLFLFHTHNFFDSFYLLSPFVLPFLFSLSLFLTLIFSLFLFLLYSHYLTSTSSHNLTLHHSLHLPKHSLHHFLHR